MKRACFLFGFLMVIWQSAYPQRPPGRLPAIIQLKDYEEDVRIISSDDDVLLGSSLAAGDLNNDGYDDLIMGAYGAKGPDGLQVGNVYIVFGGPRLFRGYSINQPAPGRTIVYGDDRLDSSGLAVASADLNGDGYDDAIIGAPQMWKGGPGQVYILYGRAEWPQEIDLNTNGAPIPGITRVRGIRKPGVLGISLASGDVNGDGIEDLVMGDFAGGPRGSNAGREGEVYVIYGSTTLPESQIIEMHQPSVPVLKVQGIAGEHARIGEFTGCLDVDEDGYYDLLIGSISQTRDNTAWRTGRVFIVHGAATMPELVDLDSVTVPAARVTEIIGEETYDYFGSDFVAGDVNGDGYRDLVVGTLEYIKDHYYDVGKFYIIFGPFPDLPVIDLRTYNGKTKVVGPDTIGALGQKVACGDVDNDGFDDIVASAPYSTTRKWRSGKTWVIYGQSQFPSILDLTEKIHRDAATQVLGYQANQVLGQDVVIGDINGDFIDDVITSAPETVTASGSLSGEVYLIYGRASNRTPSPVDTPHLSQNYPNPFNGYTTIPYQLDESTQVSLKIYSAHGQEVRKLVDGYLNEGFHSALWDGLSNQLQPVSSGIYFVYLKTTKFTEVRKILYVR